ncbi:sugar transferase [Roseomonas sp. OT10]|uniref:sugar transferase n=1 Tax=Roseomonas cutis TaxID=2897332 RepID=UPI001E4021C7|nr:sugar transferase [Roseomonas sp. OT10]UFN49838.1 sugar transferase [Roseomonas sp. OT10]
MAQWMPAQKQGFDLLIVLTAAVFAIPVLAIAALLILALEGRPVLYVSRRRVYRDITMPVAKFRTMRRNADRLINRDTVPVAGVRFLNTPSDSPVYTPIGRWIERLMLTEMPQLCYVLLGRMSLVGNRPLPENVIASLREEYPDAETRFLTPAGLTGPVQLIGRDHISDRDRLMLETTYCHVVEHAYSPLLDLRILVGTVLVGLVPGYRFTPEQVMDLLLSHARPRPHAAAGLI